jgi:hypothetical protein
LSVFFRTRRVNQCKSEIQKKKNYRDSLLSNYEIVRAERDRFSVIGGLRGEYL